jgi:O-antigen/teichoic acid export membrane protein
MFWSQSSRLLEVGITFATALLVLRGLNPEGFGTYSVLTNLVGAASVFIPVVTTESLGAALPRLASPQERLFLVVGSALLRTAVITLVTLVALLEWTHVTALFGIEGVDVTVGLMAAGYWISQDLLNTVTGFYAAEIDMRPVALWRTVGLSATLACVCVLAATNSFTVERVLIVVGAGYALSLVGLALRLRRVGRPVRPPHADIRHAVRLTPSTWLIGVLGFTLATQIDIVLISALTGSPRAAAFYAAAVGVVWRAQLLLMAGWSSMLLPLFGHSFAAGGLQLVRQAWYRSAQLFLLVALPLNALLLANAHAVTNVLFGVTYDPAGRLLAWICAFNLVASMFAAPSCVGALWALDAQKTLAGFRTFAALLNIGLAFALIPPFGAFGAVIATGTAAVASGAIDFLLARRYSLTLYPRRVGVSAVLAASVSMLPALVIRPHGFFGLVLSGGLGVLLYIGVLFAIKPLTIDDVAASAAVHPRLGGPLMRAFARR